MRAAPACPDPAAKVPVLTLPPPAIPVDASPTPQTGERVMVMRPRWLDDVFAGRKTLEVRSVPWRPQRVWLGYSGKIYGCAVIRGVTKMTEREFRNARALHLWSAYQPLPYNREKLFGLALAGVEAFAEPLPYAGGRVFRRYANDVVTKAKKKRRRGGEPCPEDRVPEGAEGISETGRRGAPKQKARAAKAKRPGNSTKKAAETNVKS